MPNNNDELIEVRKINPANRKTKVIGGILGIELSMGDIICIES